MLLLCTYRGTSQDPSKPRKYKRLHQSQYVHNSETLYRYTIRSEINRIRTIDGYTHHKNKEPRPIFQPHAIVDERTVMVKVRHASIAHSTMLGPNRSQRSAGVTQSVEHGVTFFPFVKVGDLFYRSRIRIRVHRDVSGVPSVGYDPAYPHDDVPVDEAIVGTSKNIPGYWNDLKFGISFVDRL